MWITELYASAWDQAILDTAAYLERTAHRTYTKADWIVLEAYAGYYGLKFTVDGYLIDG